MHIKSHVSQWRRRQVKLSLQTAGQMTQGTGTVQLSVTSQEPPVWHPLNFQVNVTQRNRQLDNMAFYPIPQISPQSTTRRKKREHLRGGIENVKPTFQIRLSLQVPRQLNIAQQPLTSPFRHEFVTWEEVIAVTVMRRPRCQTRCQRSLRSAH